MPKEIIQCPVKVPKPHNRQWQIIDSKAKRKIIRAGRRGGKTYVAAILALKYFGQYQKRVLYAAPTSEQTDRFWHVVTVALSLPIKLGVYKINNSERWLERTGTNNRLKAKTAWNADTLRGDFADLMIFDEFQLMNENTWTEVGAPMLLDNDGDAVFIYTPPSLRTLAKSKADNPRYAATMFKKYAADTTGRTAAFFFSSMENPYISSNALAEIGNDMTALTYRMEILAEDIDEAPTAFWKRSTIERNRIDTMPDMNRIVIAVDPSATSTGNECGLMACGKSGQFGVVLKDGSIQGSPQEWATAAIEMYYEFRADRIVCEANQGGEMVKTIINGIDSTVPVKMVWASRGKAVRAEPIAAVSEQNMIKFYGSHPKLEDELCLWTTDSNSSPNRLDAFVWGMHELMIQSAGLVFQNIWKDEYRFTDENTPLALARSYERRFVSINYGVNAAQVFLDILDDGVVLWVIKEYHHNKLIDGNKSNLELANDLTEYSKDIPDAEYILSPDSEQFEDELRIKGIFCSTPDEDIKAGVALITAMMSRGKIRVHESCKTLLSDISQYSWESRGDAPQKDIPASGNDRAISALRFACLSKVNLWRATE